MLNYCNHAKRNLINIINWYAADGHSKLYIFQLLNLSFHSNHHTLYVCTDIHEKKGTSVASTAMELYALSFSINVSNITYRIFFLFSMTCHTKKHFHQGSFAIFFLELPSWTWLFNRSIDESRMLLLYFDFMMHKILCERG